MTAQSRGQLAEQVDRALDYRGFVTVRCRDGSELVGFVYDRGPSHVELFDTAAERRLRIALDEVREVELTGTDAAAEAHARWERRRGTLEPSDTPAWGPWSDRPALILAALPFETAAIARGLGSTRWRGPVDGQLGTVRALAREIGMGGGAARAIAEHHPGVVLSCGFAGALDARLRPGDVVLASSVCDELGEWIDADDPTVRTASRELASRVKLYVGEVLTATDVATSSADKRAHFRAGRLAIDLESWCVADAARSAGIPWLALRVIVDSLDTPLPAFTRTAHHSYLRPVLRHALHGRRAVLELWRLAVAARAAARSLEIAVRSLALVGGELVPVEGGR